MPPEFWTFVNSHTRTFEILMIAFVTSITTALVTEPVKVWRQNKARERDIRKCVLTEASLNLALLSAIIAVGERLSNPTLPMMPIIRQISSEFRRTAYEKALNDFYVFNQAAEKQWIETLYWALAHIQSTSEKAAGFEASSTALMNADELLKFCRERFRSSINDMNSRATTRRMMGKVGASKVVERIQPKPLGLLMRESWRSLYADFNGKIKEVKAKSERDE